MQSNAIIIDNLCLRYQHHEIFKNFSLTIPTGKWICLLGTSGVGKSTLLRFIAGLPTGCEEISSASSFEKIHQKIHYLSQKPTLLPWLTVLNNVMISCHLINKRISPLLKTRAKALLEKVGLHQKDQLYPHQLSGGMAQRVALAQALFEDKPIILMDEPFSAVDAITRLKLQELSVELLKGRTVLLITHDPLEALRLGDIVYVLSGQPAQLSQPIIPEGNAPRANNMRLLEQQNQLLDWLL
jgi:putative hydroxymethylpyrimidine transport system ATP-binding protein